MSQIGIRAIITLTAVQDRVQTDRAYAVVHPVEPIRFSHLANRASLAREQFPHGRGLVVIFRPPTGSMPSLVA